jgi:hypothetical protein
MEDGRHCLRHPGMSRTMKLDSRWCSFPSLTETGTHASTLFPELQLTHPQQHSVGILQPSLAGSTRTRALRRGHCASGLGGLAPGAGHTGLGCCRILGLVPGLELALRHGSSAKRGLLSMPAHTLYVSGWRVYTEHCAATWCCCKCGMVNYSCQQVLLALSE